MASIGNCEMDTGRMREPVGVVGGQAMNGFTKLFNSIITSSIWSADDKVRIMWITMLASSDASGHVTGSIPGMAAIARMNLKEAEQSIAELCSPDPYSRSKEHEGRRLIKADGGCRSSTTQNIGSKETLKSVESKTARPRQSSDVSIKSANVSQCQPKQKQKQKQIKESARIQGFKSLHLRKFRNMQKVSATI